MISRTLLFRRQPTPPPAAGDHSRHTWEDGPELESSRPVTPSSPISIPRDHHETSHEVCLSTRKEHQHNGRTASQHSGRRSRVVHSPDAISPSVAALLALTAIPSRNGKGRRIRSGERLTVDAILKHTMDSEKNYTISPRRSPLEFLLGDTDDEWDEYSDTGRASFSARTVSSESVPSLDDASISEASPVWTSISTPVRRKSLPVRRIHSNASLSLSPEPVLEYHPLSPPPIDIDELDFRVFQRAEDRAKDILPSADATSERKSAFKSNLTASLKALRSAARSLSALRAPYLAPDDFLTRSIISIDPKIPFTDERRPSLEETPTPALRRYLNPTTNAPIEAHVPSTLTQMSKTRCTASIQMQTYKVSRSKGSSPSVISKRTSPCTDDELATAAGPVARQRDMRENSDFIRIAVMEMAMRKKGKLDDQKPGRAKWALPPRQAPTKPYEIGEDGVPARWIGVSP